MFFQPRLWKKGNQTTLAADCAIIGATGYAKELLEKLIRTYGVADGALRTVTVSDRLPEGFAFEREEGYALSIGADAAELSAESERGAIYGAVTLLQMASHEGLYEGCLQDAPDCAFRGYRVFLPSRGGMEDFKRMVDTIVYYKYNAISFEVGGAMEYERHPEINAAWKAFAEETHRYSGRTAEIQNGYNWSKNSIHTDNAEGDILTKDEVRQVIAYCRGRGLIVYPEVPLMSHCDYLCLAHPEIAERQEDPYPDTYCPNHPDTYQLVFDILEEIIEVFEPKVVNIGHDELYSVGLCERCKETEPHLLYVNDIIKIHDWLAERGIRTMMWGEKLLPVITKEGKHNGGAGGRRISSTGKEYDPLPMLFYCQDLLPRDIIMLHWYSAFGIQYDYVYHTHGYPVVFGNMSAGSVEEWRRRRELGIKGGTCSNWGSNQPIYLQRNNQYYNLVFGAYALWSPTYDNDQLSQIKRATFTECFHLKNGKADRGVIALTHTTDYFVPYHPFYDGMFIERETYFLGRYRVTYTDGRVEYLDVIYGENISGDRLRCDFDDEIDNSAFDDTLALSEIGLNEVSCSTIPCVREGKTYYQTVYPDPHPEAAIASIAFEPQKETTVTLLNWEQR